MTIPTILWLISMIVSWIVSAIIGGLIVSKLADRYIAKNINIQNYEFIKRVHKIFEENLK